MSSIDPVRTPTSRSRQPTSTMQPSDANHLATAVHQFKSLVIHPASNVIRHTTNTQQDHCTSHSYSHPLSPCHIYSVLCSTFIIQHHCVVHPCLWSRKDGEGCAGGA